MVTNSSLIGYRTIAEQLAEPEPEVCYELIVPLNPGVFLHLNH